MNEMISDRMPVTRIAIAGLGATGRALARGLADGVPGMSLAGVASRDQAKAAAWLRDQCIDCPVLALPSFPRHADLAVEAAPASILRRHLSADARGGQASDGAERRRTAPQCRTDRTRACYGRTDPRSTGALIGLDAVAAAAEGTISSVRLTTRKPPQGLVGAPFLEANGITLEGLDRPLLIFSGSAREAAVGFPANVNVAAALSLAGIGPDRTIVEIWADPGATRNSHAIEVEANSASFTMSIENIPSENPKTGRITALSALAALRKLHAPLRVGT